MPHYADGTPAQVGDLVRGKGYNLADEITGKVVKVTAAESCNLAVAHIDKHSPVLLNIANAPPPGVEGDTQIGYGVVVVPCIEYGECKSFTKIATLLVALTLALCGISSPAAAQSVELDLTGATAGSRFVVAVNADGKSVTVRPLGQSVKLADLGGNPPPPPPPGPQSPAVATSKLLAEQALAKPGATKQTGAGLSAVYSAVSREINTGGLDPKLATAAIALGVNEVYKKASPEDKAAWTVYSTSIARALSEASVAGDLASTGKWVAVLDDFHKGIDLATGIPIDIGTLASVDPNKAGILDGIDLAQLIELIKLILEIFKAFKTP